MRAGKSKNLILAILGSKNLLPRNQLTANNVLPVRPILMGSRLYQYYPPKAVKRADFFPKAAVERSQMPQHPLRTKKRALVSYQHLVMSAHSASCGDWAPAVLSQCSHRLSAETVRFRTLL